MVSEHPIYALFDQGDIESALNQYGGEHALRFACARQESPSGSLKASLLMAIVNRYRGFIATLVDVAAGGPPANQLIDAIEDGSVNKVAIDDWINAYNGAPPAPLARTALPNDRARVHAHPQFPMGPARRSNPLYDETCSF